MLVRTKLQFSNPFVYEDSNKKYYFNRLMRKKVVSNLAFEESQMKIHERIIHKIGSYKLRTFLPMGIIGALIQNGFHQWLGNKWFNYSSISIYLQKSLFVNKKINNFENTHFKDDPSQMIQDDKLYKDLQNYFMKIDMESKNGFNQHMFLDCIEMCGMIKPTQFVNIEKQNKIIVHRFMHKHLYYPVFLPEEYEASIEDKQIDLLKTKYMIQFKLNQKKQIRKFKDELDIIDMELREQFNISLKENIEDIIESAYQVNLTQVLNSTYEDNDRINQSHELLQNTTGYGSLQRQRSACFTQSTFIESIHQFIINSILANYSKEEFEEMLSKSSIVNQKYTDTLIIKDLSKREKEAQETIDKGQFDFDEYIKDKFKQFTDVLKILEKEKMATNYLCELKNEKYIDKFQKSFKQRLIIDQLNQIRDKVDNKNNIEKFYQDNKLKQCQEWNYIKQ